MNENTLAERSAIGWITSIGIKLYAFRFCCVLTVDPWYDLLSRFRFTDQLDNLKAFPAFRSN